MTGSGANVVDADGHVLEPMDLWDRYLDPRERRFAPRAVRNDPAVIRAYLGEEETEALPPEVAADLTKPGGSAAAGPGAIEPVRK